MLTSRAADTDNPSPAPATRGRWLAAFGLTTWLVTIVSGLGMLWAYAGTAGTQAAPKVAWPAAASITRDTRGPVLLLFLHPHCPCSRATLSELARVMAGAPAPAATYVFVYRPPDAEAGWEHTGLWDSAAALRGVQVMTDVDGAQARLFGAGVSGHALLYSAAGELLFSGGITGARGHEGDNPGRTALMSSLAGAHSALLRTSVFGCFLHREAGPRTDSELP